MALYIDRIYGMYTFDLKLYLHKYLVVVESLKSSTDISLGTVCTDANGALLDMEKRLILCIIWY